MKTALEILKPFIEKPFRRTEIVSPENAIKAMEEYVKQKEQSKIVTVNIESLSKFINVVNMPDMDPANIEKYFTEAITKAIDEVADKLPTGKCTCCKCPDCSGTTLIG